MILETRGPVGRGGVRRRAAASASGETSTPFGDRVRGQTSAGSERSSVAPSTSVSLGDPSVDDVLICFVESLRSISSPRISARGGRSSQNWFRRPAAKRPDAETGATSSDHPIPRESRSARHAVASSSLISAVVGRGKRRIVVRIRVNAIRPASQLCGGVPGDCVRRFSASPASAGHSVKPARRDGIAS